MKKQTAVEWLIEHLEDVGLDYVLGLHTDLIVQAKAMEREQMQSAFCEGSKLIECPNELSAQFEFILYYNETYKEPEQ